jgi:transposase
VIEQAQQAAAQPPCDERATPLRRWTLRRLTHEERFGRRFCRETIRAALHRLKLSWKKKLLGRADPAPSVPGRTGGAARRRGVRRAPAGLH